MNQQFWHSQNIENILTQIESDPDFGLSQEEAQKRLSTYGPNVLKGAPPKSLLKMLLGHLNDALIYVLLGAVVITMLMGEYIDAIIILAVVLLNTVLGVVQEKRAGNAIEALKKLASPKALVKRNGQLIEIAGSELSIGDLVILDAGRYVPADLRLTETANLKIDESALTGESIAVEKDAAFVIEDNDAALGDCVNMAYMSTLATYGRGQGVVVAIANDTEVGKIANIISQEEEVVTPLEKKLEELGKVLGKIAVVVCLLMFSIGYFQGRDLADMFLTAVSLAVASIPEGLAAIVAIVLSIGVTKMAKQNAIIKKLPAVETLGSVNIICSDKTGTLTQNKMTVTHFFTFSDQTLAVEGTSSLSNEGKLLVKAMVLNSDATLEGTHATGDPTELALLMLADDLKQDRLQMKEAYPRIDEQAFDSDRKMMSTLHDNNQGYVIFTKGAIDNLILKCKYIVENGEVIPFTETHKKLLMMASDEMSEKALRTLAVAYKPIDKIIPKEDFEHQLIMIGVVGMIDPPREEVKDSIRLAKNAGITTIMITGDHKNTALAIAKELGIADNPAQAITGNDLNSMNKVTFQNNIANYRVFARVSPEHKVNIVKAFQSKGNIVSMTGDGVNDAPSLNAADIGVAMGITGTDVAKNASDMILADDNFSTIVSAIEEGRNIYNNIKKSVVFLLSSNVGEVICMLLAILVGMPVPLIATQLLWINLVTDSLPAIALGMDPGSKDVMNDTPRSSKESFFNGSIGTVAIGGISIGIVTIISYWLGFIEYGFSPFDNNIPDNVLEYARTMAFMTIIACQLFYSLTFRHPYLNIFKAGVFKNKYLTGAIVLGFAIQTLVLEIPVLQNAFKLQSLHWKGWLEVIGLGLIPLILNEVFKVFKGNKSF